MTDEKWQTLLDNFVRDATKVGELSKSQTRSRLNFILSEHTRRIVEELEGMRIDTAKHTFKKGWGLAQDDWNVALDEAIKRIERMV